MLVDSRPVRENPDVIPPQVSVPWEGIWTHLIHCSLESTRVHIPNDILIDSVVLAGITVVIDSQADRSTDRPTDCSVAIDQSIASAVMRPKINSGHIAVALNTPHLG